MHVHDHDIHRLYGANFEIENTLTVLIYFSKLSKKNIIMDIFFWMIFLTMGIVAFTLLIKTNVKLNKIVSNKEFFPKDPQVNYFIDKNKK